MRGVCNFITFVVKLINIWDWYIVILISKSEFFAKRIYFGNKYQKILVNHICIERLRDFTTCATDSAVCLTSLTCFQPLLSAGWRCYCFDFCQTQRWFFDSNFWTFLLILWFNSLYLLVLESIKSAVEHLSYGSNGRNGFYSG